jgi:hemerythrin-like domain-containing protein
MLHSSRENPNDGDRTLLDRLLDCHDRIREMLSRARELGQRPSDDEDETRAAAERIQRYFTRALSMHTKDEEESISPRLMKPAARGALERMEHEHREHEKLVAALVAACKRVADAPSRRSALAPELLLAVDALEPPMLAHLEEEERDVFPLLASLDAEAHQHIFNEMEGRREADGGGGRGAGRRRG